ncbi:long-chain-fatty-acid--CoA ligase [Thermodesulfobacteriota bacterium]
MKELIFHGPFLRAAEGYPERIIVQDGMYSATFVRHLDRTCRLANTLKEELGIKRDDRYAVLSGNRHHYLELWHAGLLGGGVINPINIRLNPQEIKYILNDSETQVIFVDPTYAEMIDSIRSETPSLRQVVLIGNADVPHDMHYDELIENARPVIPEETEEDDPCILMYTGGTTGLPKGVLIDQRAINLNIYHMVIHYHLDETFCYLLFMPMFHVGALLGTLGPAVSGGRVVIIPGFDEKLAMDTIEREHVTDAGMVPTMLALILNHPEFKPERLSSLRTIGYGAAPMPEGLLRRVLELFPNLGIFQGYGMTEASGVITHLSTADHHKGGKRLRSVGRRMFGVQMIIQDFDGNTLPPGDVGEVCIKTGSLMRCYLNLPEATEEAIKDGWYHTGDMGYLDEGGYLFLVDRAKDMIVTGGENVYSLEVENAISTHTSVAQVAVIGIPHEIWGEAIHAIVVINSGMSVTDEEIKTYARQTLANYKIPKTVEIRTDPLPLSAAGKILKRELRKPYWEDSDRNI